MQFRELLREYPGIPRVASRMAFSQDDGKGGLSLRGVAFMTVLAVLTV